MESPSTIRGQRQEGIMSYHQYHHNLIIPSSSPLNSPRTNIAPTSNPNGSLAGGGILIANNNNNNNNNNTGGIVMEIPGGTPPLTPKSISRSEPNPYPTTFVQADSSNFKQVVQMLTGSSETVTKQQPDHSFPQPQSSSKSMIPPVRTPAIGKRSAQQQQGFKLYERRNRSHLKNMNSLIINTLVPAGFISPRNNNNNKPLPPEILSPSMLDFPKLALSPVTPLSDPFTGSTGSSPSLCSSSSSSSSEEERVIAEKGFYLHPSPMNTPKGGAEPQLLPLFPVTSPRVSSASS